MLRCHANRPPLASAPLPDDTTTNPAPVSTGLPARLALLNLATLLFAGVGVVVPMIDWPASQIAFGRGLFASAALLAFLLLLGQPPLRVRRRADWLWMAVLGLSISGNWWLFFRSIQLAGVAVAVVSLYTYPLITALLEPVLYRERWQPWDLAGAAIVLVGVALIVPRFSLADDVAAGVLLGVLSAWCLAINNLTGRRMVRGGYSATGVMFVQFAIATALFAPSLAMDLPQISWPILAKLAVLGALLTTVASVLFADSLRYFDTSTASVLLSLQPLYATLLAWWLVGEVPAPRTVAGGAVVVLAVVTVVLKHRSGAVSQAGESIAHPPT